MSLSRYLTLGLTGLSALIIAALALTFLAVSGASAANPVYVNPALGCGGMTPCYATIQEGVDNVDVGGTVNVFPGNYPENVELSGAAGGLTLVSVDSTGAPAPGATVNPAAGIPISANCAPGALVIDGFTLTSVSADALYICGVFDATINNVNANNRVNVEVASHIAVTNSHSTDSGDDGFELETDPGDVTVTDSTVTGAGNEGFDISIYGDVTISGSSADNSFDDGFDIHAFNTTINGSDADDNGDDGFDVDDQCCEKGLTTITIDDSHASGNSTKGENEDNFDLDATGAVTISNSSAVGSLDDDGFQVDTYVGPITITNTTSNENDDEGFELDTSGDPIGTVTIDGVTALDNGNDGLDIEQLDGFLENVTVKNSYASRNQSSGVDLDYDSFEPTGTFLTNGNILCENVWSGYAQGSPITGDVTGNWWGATTGPTHPNNPGGTGDSIVDGDNPDDDGDEDNGQGTTNFIPWIDTGSGSGAPATQGQPSAVTFQFTGGNGAEQLQQGPGDPNGDPTFTASTDNGTVTTSGFISGGTLEVTLTPANAGQATVTVTGPCGLTATTAPIAVAAGAAAPTPVATPVQLPETGGSPDGGSASSLPLALSLAFMAVLGLGGFALSRRRATG